MAKLAGIFFGGVLLLMVFSNISYAQYGQGTQLGYSQMFRLGVGMIRIAEPGELADTLNLWGDVNAPGRYLVPRGTKVPELLSFAQGPSRMMTGSTEQGWSDVRLEVNIARFDRKEKRETVKSYKFYYYEPLPSELYSYKLLNEDVVSVQVRRSAVLADYVNFLAPAISAIATAILAYASLK
ncbi:hypothetical protein HGB07_04435 [Candidatus Roizmanbacteria bacterium]|nr:hypothetical protein [Candidatus Roizmanbacteria bacterium]